MVLAVLAMLILLFLLVLLLMVLAIHAKEPISHIPKEKAGQNLDLARENLALTIHG